MQRVINIISADVGAQTPILGGREININPYRRPGLHSISGPFFGELRRTIAHELGHAVTGTGDWDVAEGLQMANIVQNEWLITDALGLRRRTAYGPALTPLLTNTSTLHGYY